MRVPRLPALLAAAAFVLLGVAGPSAGAFGQPGPIRFAEVEVPVPSAPEPTIGIPWDTDHLFYHAGATTLRATWDGDTPAWEDVTPPYQVPENLDPMLWADPDTNRIYAGGLHGPCSIMMMSDDDGETWVPTGNMCSGKDFDHQSLSSGPPAGAIPASPTHPHVVYYCGQFGTISCARSLDGGQTFLPFQTVPGPCGGFHGHIRVSRATGMVAVPVGDCGDDHGFAASKDGGLTWESYTIPDTEQWSNGFDPALQFTRPGGWLYYAMASEHGVHVALSKDEGATWEPLGGGHGEPATWLDLGALHDPPIVAGAFSNLEAGDDDRVAVSFLGLEGGPGADLDFLRSNQIYACDERQDELVWHYYTAFSYDAGQTWTVQRISEDPVQRGGIYDSVVSGSGTCRNLLDFNDMKLDSQGRVHIAFADGCTGACASEGSTSSGYRDRAARLYRQVEGRGLFAAADVAPTQPDLDADGTPDTQDEDLDGDGSPNGQDEDLDGDGTPNTQETDLDSDGVADTQDQAIDIVGYTPPAQDTPAAGMAFLAVVVALGLVARRRRA